MLPLSPFSLKQIKHAFSIKRQTAEKIFANHVSDKGLVSRI